VALAGVMGCANTQIMDQTKNIVLESAVFRPLSVRKTSSRLGLRSEASVRFERGVDVNTSLEAVEYACYLLEKYADAIILSGYAHAGTKHIDNRVFHITEEYIRNYLGISLSLSELSDIFVRLGFKATKDKNEVVVEVPNRRLDITIREDLVEEVARIKGYDSLNETLPLMNVNSIDTESQVVRSNIKKVLSEMGLHEVLTYSLINENTYNYFNYLFPEVHDPIKILNPMTEDHSVLRLSLVNSLIDVIKYNSARKIFNLSVFEVAKRYHMEEDQGVEEWCLAGALSGEFAGTKWTGKVEKVDFYLVKGILETLFKKMGMDLKFQKITKNCSELHPYRSAEILNNGHVIGYVGAVHPKFASENDLEETYVFEILLTSFINKEETVIQFEPISRFPSVERDLALVVSEDVQAGDLINAVYSTDRKLIKNVEVFDLYRGENLEPGTLSIALKITMEANETLTDEFITEKIKKIVKSLEFRYHARLRS
jgi:phenylalanyl-tRNA synthetase beta chain